MKEKIVYFAGKVSSGGGYRYDLFSTGRLMSYGITRISTKHGKSFLYGGPFALSDDHSCWHGKGSHGFGIGGDSQCAGTLAGEQLDPPFHGDYSLHWDSKFASDVVKRCLRQIREADIVHCYIDSQDCYGTLVELGFASALGKKICLVVHPNITKTKELWFAKNLVGPFITTGTPNLIHGSVFGSQDLLDWNRVETYGTLEIEPLEDPYPIHTRTTNRYIPETEIYNEEPPEHDDCDAPY